MCSGRPAAMTMSNKRSSAARALSAAARQTTTIEPATTQRQCTGVALLVRALLLRRRFLRGLGALRGCRLVLRGDHFPGDRIDVDFVDAALTADRKVVRVD